MSEYLDEIQRRALVGADAIYPDIDRYGKQVFGQNDVAPGAIGANGLSEESTGLEKWSLVPPIFIPERMDKLIAMGREPNHTDVDLSASVGGFPAKLPVYISALGSTTIASNLADSIARQAAELAIPLVIGENVAVRRPGDSALSAGWDRLARRVDAYFGGLEDPALGGLVIQQSVGDADSELWNRLYSSELLDGPLSRGLIGFELKLGQGAKPGLGGVSVVSLGDSEATADSYYYREISGSQLSYRYTAPGTVTKEVLVGQLRFMRNNFPDARIWVKLPPGRDVAEVASVCWAFGVDAVVVDGAEGGSGWAPLAFLRSVGLPLAECLQRLYPLQKAGHLLASGGIWRGEQALKCMALGATAVGLGRPAIVAARTDPKAGLVRFVDAMREELSLLLSALGLYELQGLSRRDLWRRDLASE